MVIYGLKELNSDSLREKTEEDLKVTAELLKSVDVSDQHIDKLYRLGKSNGKMDRPLLVCLNSQIKRDQLISSWRNLDRDKRENVYINPDLTFEERKRNKELRDELKERKANGEIGLVVRNGKVVNKSKETNPNIEQAKK